MRFRSVAVDGCYLLYPNSLKRPASPIEQSHAILEACAAVNLPVTLHRNNEPYYGNEVEKRNLSFDLARQVATEDDYFLVFDADEVASYVAGDFKQQLEDAQPLCADYGVYNYETHLQQQKDVNNVESPNDQTSLSRITGIYRNLPKLGYINAHWIVAGMYKDEPIFLWGNPRMHQPMAEACDLSYYLKLDHRNAQREMNRSMNARRYYAQRDKLGVEALGKTYFEGVDGRWDALPGLDRV